MDMNLQKYLSFVKTVEYGSFTKAAEALNYSQSGISRMISDLENEWGVALLERAKNGVTLTSEGEKILPYAKSLCCEFDRLAGLVGEINNMNAGLIRIGVFSSVATHWLPNVINEFIKDYPGIEYELVVGEYREIEEWVENGRVDFGFLELPVQRNIDTVFLEKDELVVILPKNHPFSSQDCFPVSELEKEPFILLERNYKSEISAFFEKNNIVPDIKYTTWDDYAIMSMVEKGLGIAILPQLILKRIDYDIVIKSLDVPVYRNIGIAIRSKDNISPIVRNFLEYLKYR
ncbi:MAG: LysR family transcriptional regulator [Oscillospiraceae bacterium]|nr:LysR family transcriptional regulator [Oscillospiraceae bacterium]